MQEAINSDSIEFNEQFAKAIDLLENGGEHLFITGKAGTGKSTLLQYFREHTSKKIAVLAPTGVSAINIKGQTIHSFFRFKPDITPDSVYSIVLRRRDAKIFKRVDTIVIDEISMVRADLLDCIDTFLRIYGKDGKKPFGGIQMVFFGDLYQLPPVVTRAETSVFKDIYKSPYFFDAKCYRLFDLKFFELTTIYRQKDDEFIQLLGDVRNNTVVGRDLNKLNERHIPDFKPDDDDLYISLTTTNALADSINQQRLSELHSDIYVCEGDVVGDFDTKSLPTQTVFRVKEGAQVMLLNNDPQGRWINGSIGKVTYLNQEGFGSDIIEVLLETGKKVEVAPFTWEMFKFSFNEETESLESESVGSFRQYPLRLAWAITIHKSQGKTFSNVIIDFGRGTFSHGQSYVALSRCQSLDGIVLKRPFMKSDIILDDRIVTFMFENMPGARLMINN